MALIDSISVARNQVYKGASYIAYGSLVSFPGELESVIHPTSYALAAGLTELCPTSEDGVSLTRSADVSDGIPIDQKKTNLSESEPETWSQEVSFTMLDTTVAALKIIWATEEPVAVVGSVVNQQRLPLNAPATFTERQLYIVQEDESTGRMRVFAFRKTVPQVDSEMNIQSSDAAGAPATFKIREDTTLAAHHGPYGYIFEEDA